MEHINRRRANTGSGAHQLAAYTKFRDELRQGRWGYRKTSLNSRQASQKTHDNFQNVTEKILQGKHMENTMHYCFLGNPITSTNSKGQAISKHKAILQPSNPTAKQISAIHTEQQTRIFSAI